ncbi:MAG TPA: hypothetical protein V6C58_07585 [Allocoleopsis sp.]
MDTTIDEILFKRVRSIKFDLAQGILSDEEIAQKYGVKLNVLLQVKNGIRWKHLT